MASDKKSLCSFKSGDIKDDPAAYKKLVKGAKYVCLKCGRAAKRKRNLCKPSAL